MNISNFYLLLKSRTRRSVDEVDDDVAWRYGVHPDVLRKRYNVTDLVGSNPNNSMATAQVTPKLSNLYIIHKLSVIHVIWLLKVAQSLNYVLPLFIFSFNKDICNKSNYYVCTWGCTPAGGPIPASCTKLIQTPAVSRTVLLRCRLKGVHESLREGFPASEGGCQGGWA